MDGYKVVLNFEDKTVYNHYIKSLTVTLANAAIYKDKEGFAEPTSPLGSSILLLTMLMDGLDESSVDEILNDAKKGLK